MPDGMPPVPSPVAFHRPRAGRLTVLYRPGTPAADVLAAIQAELEREE